MQIPFTEHYSPAEIDAAREEIQTLQENLNKIEDLYRQFHSTFDHQQIHIEQITSSINQTETNLEKGGFDMHEILQIRRKKDKWQCLVVIFVCTTACFFLLIVISVLINVIQTFALKRTGKANRDR